LSNDNNEKRGHARFQSRLAATARFVEAGGTKVIATASGLVADVSFSGLKLVMSEHPPGLKQALERGAVVVDLEITHGSYPKLEALGEIKWSQVNPKDNVLVIGVRYSKIDTTTQQRLVEWSLQSADQKATVRWIVYAAAVALVGASILQTWRLGDAESERDELRHKLVTVSTDLAGQKETVANLQRLVSSTQKVAATTQQQLTETELRLKNSAK
jgi:hypothetical protein